MLWKLIAVNLIFWIVSTIISARLRVTQNFLSPESNNELTYLATKNSIKILYNFIWIAALFVFAYLNVASICSLLITFMMLSALVSFFHFLRYCTPGKKEYILMASSTMQGYGHLILSLFLIPISRVVLLLIIRGII